MELQTLLRIPIYEKASVVAGQKGVTRKVHNVNMMDAPDILSFLKEGEFLITTGYHFKEHEESLAKLVEGMAKKKCAGLAIKTKRFFEHVPASICQLADELHFPIIDFQTDETLGAVINESLSFILDKKTAELQQAMVTHQLFSSYILQGKGIEKIMQSIQTLCNAHVALFDTHGHELFYTNKREPFSLPMEEAAAGAKQLFLRTSKYTTFSFLHTKKTVTLFPIATHTRKYSYLLIEHQVSLSDSALLTIEQATNVLSFEMMRQQALYEAERRRKNDFFNQLVNNYYKTLEDASFQAQMMGLSAGNSYICAVGKIHSTFTPYSDDDMIYELLQYELSTGHTEAVLFFYDNLYILLFTPHSQPMIIECLHRLQEAVYRHYDKRMSFGVGNQSQSLLTIADSYKEAVEALETIHFKDQSKLIQFYQPKQFKELLRLLPANDLQDYYSQTLEGLLQYDKKDRSILLDTLETYLNSNCQISETAKQLFVHRNTVIYRIEKCEELLKRPIHTSEETLRLRVAFQIFSLVHAN
ncbi:PucR family transcriptional regulator [Bacillus megaterium]|uniref:PucR family transcriptional regulator n=1 Tax=Priestia megaterium TaxID=1404 RepID=UPI001293D50D|nr:PucR family transcriptional regulator [Priestia megaterium]MQR87061.1 PucR family transcriptional regulator [Priestia megaterium]